jgi:hypothetical protein
MTSRPVPDSHLLVPAPDGRYVPGSEQDRAWVNVNVTGHGELLGTDAGDLLDKQPYASCRRRLYFGQCIAVIRARRGAGRIDVRITSEVLPPVEASIDVQPLHDAKR